MERYPLIEEMTDREIAEETLTIMRALQDALVAISQNPMLKMMIPGGLNV